MKRPFARFLALAVALALAFGQGPVSAVMAMPMANPSDQAAAMTGMPAMDMPAAHQASKHCCSDDGKAMKKARCAACCAAAAQMAMLPSLAYRSVRYPVTHVYALTDTTGFNKTLPPDLPPPKV